MGILNFLATRNYIAVNKDLIKIIGLEETIILGELASEHNYFDENEELEDGYFYSTINNIEENTGLNEYKQRKAINNLKENNLIDIKIKGTPARRFIKINESQVEELLNFQFLKNSRTSSLNFKELVPKNLKINKNNIIKINNNKKENIKRKKYGEFKRVLLTDDEYERLKKEFGEVFINRQIKLLDEYIESNNNKNKYTNFNLVLRKSIRENWFNKTANNTPAWFDKDLNKKEEQNDGLKDFLRRIGKSN